jgi:signal transduction histidine kinase
MLLAISGILGGYSGKVGDEVREDLEIVEKEIARLTRLVNDLLDLARIESRRIELNITETSAHEIVQTAVEQVSGLAEAQCHSIRTSIPKDLPALRVDKDRIIQVIINLLSNSIKYSPERGEIAIKAEHVENGLAILVADNGYGIPLWAQKKIFDKFFQADSIMSQRVGGSGLGLTISREIVQLHGGAIKCTSPLPQDRFPDLSVDGERKGSVFEVILHVSANNSIVGMPKA